MIKNKQFDAIIIGGSYSGLAAAMALGRALKEVLIIDNGKPCNAQTPVSGNFLTQDGRPPAEIAAVGKLQLEKYDSVTFFKGLATDARKTEIGFEVQVASGETLKAKKLIFATGIRDIPEEIEGLASCWGISVLHCPYCHGYEVRNQKTGVLGNGEHGYELTRLISNWAGDLTLFTNGTSTLTSEQAQKLRKHGVKIMEEEVGKMEHLDGYIQNIVFKDGMKCPLTAIYTRSLFVQHCQLLELLGCELSEEGYVKVDVFQETNIHGVYACGDNVSRMRTIANAVAMGTATGMTVSKRLIFEEF